MTGGLGLHMVGSDGLGLGFRRESLLLHGIAESRTGRRPGVQLIETLHPGITLASQS